MKQDKVYVLDDLPSLGPSEEGEVFAQQIAGALTGLLQPEEGVKHTFPSLIRLTHFYACTHLDIYDALRLIKAQGYDYELSGIDQNITIWFDTDAL